MGNGSVLASGVSRDRLVRLLRQSLILALVAVGGSTLAVRLRLLERWAEAIQPAEGFGLRVWTALILVLLLAFAVIATRNWLILARTSSRLYALYRVSQIVSSVLDPAEVAQQVVTTTRDIIGYSHIAVLMVRGDRLVPIASAGYPDQLPELRVGQGITGRVARTGQLEYLPDVATDPNFVPGVSDTTSEIACPITVEGQAIGVLNVETVGGRQLKTDDVELVASLAVGLGKTLQNALLHEKIREQAIRDGLTGLFDHATFHEQIREELARARRYGRPMALIMSDLDDFKLINDTYGHVEGDRVLRLFADTIRRAIRDVDLPARYGGEEFAIIMPETPRSGAGSAAERIRQLLAKEVLQIGGAPISVRASFGVAVFPDDAEEVTDLIRRADAALYVAKRSGKNQVRTAAEPALRLGD